MCNIESCLNFICKIIFSGGPLVQGVEYPHMVTLPDGTLLSIGGGDINGNTVGTIQEYDTEAKTWSLRQETMVAPKFTNVAMVPDDWCNINNI